MKHMLLEMSKESSIISKINLNLDLEVCINSGAIVSHKKSIISVKDTISNEGSLIMNEKSLLTANTLINHNHITGRMSKISVD